MLRTVPARWFELLVPRSSVSRALEALAETGLVQLDSPSQSDEAFLSVPSLEEPLERFAVLERRYQKYWPAPVLGRPRGDRLLERELDRALKRVEAWRIDAEPHIEGIERTSRQRGELELLEALCRAAVNSHKVDFHDLTVRTPAVAAEVFMLPPESDTPELADPILYRRLDEPDATWLLTFGRVEQVQRLAQALEGRHARTLEVPPMLARSASARDALHRVRRRLAAAERLLARHRRALERLQEKHRLAGALGTLHRVQWLDRHLPSIGTSDYMARVHGWTSDPDGNALTEALDRVGIPHALAFPPPPIDREAPSLSVNPPWAKPFELFAGLVGTPGRDEADPSVLVAFIAPLLFGYMFGDVGQGAVLVAAGILLSRRFPASALLIWGGAWSIVFGFAFGSVFGSEDIIPALWLHPVVDPLPVLTVPVVFGAFLIVLSILLSGLEHLWVGRLGSWVRTEAGMGLALLLGLAGFVEPSLLPAAAVVLALQFLAMLWEFRANRGMAVAKAVAEMVEGLMRLAVNTLSFVRVGAFALAHAGLSLAVVTLAEGAGGGVAGIVVMILGNALIIAIEGLVASIQMTRLVLFEFFTRFLTAEGRAFRPLAPPA
ncbi:MAG: ATPase [Candidatus Wenzhouxiangella sp. M2_3B_020]